MVLPLSPSSNFPLESSSCLWSQRCIQLWKLNHNMLTSIYPIWNLQDQNVWCSMKPEAGKPSSWKGSDNYILHLSRGREGLWSVLKYLSFSTQNKSDTNTLFQTTQKYFYWITAPTATQLTELLSLMQHLYCNLIASVTQIQVSPEAWWASGAHQPGNKIHGSPENLVRLQWRKKALYQGHVNELSNALSFSIDGKKKLSW